MDSLTFTPLYMKRVWGGHSLHSIYGRTLPNSDTPIGESWEISDRPNEQSIVNFGPLKGVSLGKLWKIRRREIFGDGFENQKNFPLLIKILDAQSDLSIQVHPPASVAKELNGEPKSEMWYIAHATPGAKLYVGLKKNITRETFEACIRNNTVEQAIHSISPKAGDSIFIPSGRIHAIGAGLLIYEIQQNSDTTYRVFDWNRLGFDGSPRELHIEESMRSIDFSDIEPSMDHPEGNILTRCPYFTVERLLLSDGTSLNNPDPERFSILTVVSGNLISPDGRSHGPGTFLLHPRNARPLTARGTEGTVVLQTTIECSC